MVSCSRLFRVLLLVGFVLLNVLVISSILVSHALLGRHPTTPLFLDHLSSFEKANVNNKIIVDNNKNNNNTRYSPASTIQEIEARNPQIRRKKEKRIKNITETLLKKDHLATLKKLSQVGSLNMTDIYKYYSSRDLPPWSSVERQYGKKPLILGLEKCQEYRDANLPQNRWVSPAGLFHSGKSCNHKTHQHQSSLHQVVANARCTSTFLKGTNLMGGMLASSCFGIIPHFQVPWGKHNPWKAHSEYKIDKPMYQQVNVSSVLPIVMVRHVLDWMPSMCEQPYAAKWPKSSTSICPSLQNASVTVGLYQQQNYKNLVDFWKNWNAEYFHNTETPRLVVRLEDLVYYPQETLESICSCVGGHFKYSPPPNVRQGGNTREAEKEKLSLVEAWKRHAHLPRLKEQEDRDMVQSDKELLEMMKALHYYDTDGSEEEPVATFTRS